MKRFIAGAIVGIVLASAGWRAYAYFLKSKYALEYCAFYSGEPEHAHALFELADSPSPEKREHARKVMAHIIKSWTIDSLYLTLLWKMGLVGLAAFAWMGYRLLRLAYRTFKQSDDPQVRAFASGALALLMGMGVLGISDASMVNGRFALVFATIFGMIAVVARDVDKGRT